MHLPVYQMNQLDTSMSLRADKVFGVQLAHFFWVSWVPSIHAECMNLLRNTCFPSYNLHGFIISMFIIEQFLRVKKCSTEHSF